MTDHFRRKLDPGSKFAKPVTIVPDTRKLQDTMFYITDSKEVHKYIALLVQTGGILPADVTWEKLPDYIATHQKVAIKVSQVKMHQTVHSLLK